MNFSRPAALLGAAACLLAAGCQGSLSSFTPSGTPHPQPSGLVNGGTNTAAIAIANVRLANVMRFAANADGAATPTVTLQGGIAPNAAAFDSSGNLYVAGGNNAISVYAPGAAQPFNTIANGQICRLGGIAVDGAGAVYAADPICDQIVKLVPQAGGTYTVAWYISGAQTGLSGTIAVGLDGSGNVYALNLPDSVHTAPPAVTVYNPSGASGQSNLAPAATISGGTFPSDVRGFGIDPSGDVFIATASVISEYVPGGGYHVSGSIQDTNLCGIESIATGSSGSSRYVVAANSCGPQSTGNGTLTAFDVTTPLSGAQDPKPLVIAGNATGLNVAAGSATAFDSSGHSAATMYAGSELLNVLSGYCLCDSSSAPQYQLSTGHPGLDGVQAIWFAGGKLYSSDGATPAISLYAQPPDTAPAPLTPAPLMRIAGPNTRLCGPASVVTDANANVYVSNDCSSNGNGANSNTLQKFNAPATGSGGDQNLAPAWTTTPGTCPAPNAATLCNPQQIAIDGNANVYVTNYGGNSIDEYSSSGTQIAVMTAAPQFLHRPSGIALDLSGDLVVYSDAENDSGGNYPGLIAFFTKPSGSGNVTLTETRSIAGTGTTLPAAQFGQIALDPSGNVFVNLFKSIVVYGPGASGTDAPIRTITPPAGGGGTGIALAP